MHRIETLTRTRGLDYCPKKGTWIPGVRQE